MAQQSQQPDDFSDGLVPRGQQVQFGPGVTGTFHGDPKDLANAHLTSPTGDPASITIEQPLVSARMDDFRDGLVEKTPAKKITSQHSAASKSQEGTYQMVGKDGKTTAVKYSDVLSSIHSGHQFADKETLNKFARDHAADPNNSNNRSDQTIAAMSSWNPLKYLASVGAGVQDVLEGAGGEVMKVATAFDRPATTGGETEAQLAAAAPNKTVGQGLGAVGEQIGELGLVPEVEGPKAATAAARAARVALGAGRGAAEQGVQSLVHSSGDTEQAKQAATVGAVAGGLAPLATDTISAIGPFFKNLLRHRMDIDEFEAEKWVGEVRKANQKIDEEAADVRVKNLDLAKKAREAGNEAEATRLEHNNVVQKEQAVNAKRQNLQDALAKTRQAIQQRLQTMHDAARVYFRGAYSDLEKEAGSHATSYADLAEDVHDALEKVKGSDESTRAFKDILSRAKGVEEAEEAEGFSLEDLANLAPDEQARLRESLAEGGEENAAGATLAHLNGYYSELGRVLDSGAVAGDVKAAARVLRDRIDGRIQEMLGPDLYKKNLLLRSQYRTFAEGFKDYAGPAGSGSPIALSLKAKDPYHATQPFLGKSGKTSEVGRRVRGIIVGDAKDPATQFLGKDVADSYARDAKGRLTEQGGTTPAWRYRRQTAGLVDHLRNLQTGLEALEKRGSRATDLAKATSTSAQAVEDTRVAAKEASREAAKAEPVPTATPVSPADLRAAKATALHQAAHNLGKYGLWVSIGGLAGGTGIFLKTGDLKKSLEVAAGGVAAGLLTPYLASKMLDQPGVVSALTKLSKKDLNQLMALPSNERTGVESAIKQLADTAVKEGRLKQDKIPWLRIIGGTTARQVTTSPTSKPATIVPGEMPLSASQPSLMPLPTD